MQSKPVPSAFSALNFTHLSPVSYIYKPKSTSTTLSTSKPVLSPSDANPNPFSDTNALPPPKPQSSSPQPDLILFPSWLDALPKHTAKYLLGYQALYPKSVIIVITHKILDDILGTRKNKLLWYGPVADYLQSLSAEANVLLHSVSNGGALSIVSVAQIYRERTGKPLPIKAQVLDSSPGKPSFWSDIDAVTIGIPSLPIRLVAKVVITLGSFLAKILYILIRKQHPVIALRAKMIDTTLFNIRAPRVYIYSKEDRMVSWKAVEEHVAESRAKGYQATGEEFKGSKHVAHMMMDPERYWGIIGKLWISVIGEEGRRFGNGVALREDGKEVEGGEEHAKADIVQLQ